MQGHAVDLICAIDQPVAIAGDAANSQFKIDRFMRAGSALLITGWATNEELAFETHAHGKKFECAIARHVRRDVIAALALSDVAQSGFVIFADDFPDGGGSLRFSFAEQNYVVEFAEPDTGQVADQDTLEGLRTLLADVAVGSKKWSSVRTFIAETPAKSDQLCGYIDFAFTSSAGGFLSGWVLNDPDIPIWLEDDTGRAWDLQDAYRWQRQDVSEADIPFSAGGRKTGFLKPIVSSGGADHFRIAGCGPYGRISIPATKAKIIKPDVATMGRALFQINTPWFDCIQRAHAADIPILTRVQKSQRAVQATIEPSVLEYGTAPATPKISIIIPLFGRYEMIENQLLDFAHDPSFGTSVELIYVNDDPKLENILRSHAGPMHDILKVPFQIVSAGDNRGFSAANNLGASKARGETLVFMNSDVFPTAIGCADALAKILDDRPDIGLISPRLLFPDGSIQHAGMEPCWRETFGVWTNRHPRMGFDKSLDPTQGTTNVPLVSGACVAIRSDDFKAAGGWSTDYFIGDFEDSDLCFKIRARGLSVAYTTDVELTHLERQSIPAMGEDTFRQRITMINAALYNKRWFKELREMTS